MRNNRGFSLLELLIVVAIILIIATIAIPSLLRSRQSANESAAVSNIRSINTAQVTYSASNQIYATIDELVDEGLMDSRFNSGAVSGYEFVIDEAEDDFPDTYTVTAMPTAPNSGRYGYYSGPDLVVRYLDPADCDTCEADTLPGNAAGGDPVGTVAAGAPAPAPAPAP